MPEDTTGYPTWSPTKEERRVMDLDSMMISEAKDYRQPYDEKRRRAAFSWMLLRQPSPYSNVATGLARMVAQTSISAMTQGRPMADFIAVNDSDTQKAMVWSAAADLVLDQNNFDAKQRQFITDFSVPGMSYFDVTTQIPLRKSRIKTKKGQYREIIRYDHRKPRIKIQVRNPQEVWLGPWADTVEEVTWTYDEQRLTKSQWNVFRQSRWSDGELKFKNTDYVIPGFEHSMVSGKIEVRENVKHGVVIGRVQDEDNDVLRLYANGVLIYDGPLQKRVGSEEGLNALGENSLCVGYNNHQYDKNLSTHSLYATGDVGLISGLERVYDAFANMSIDNMKLASSFVVSGQGAEELDLDNTSIYSGAVVPGDVNVQSIGATNFGEYSYLKDTLDEWVFILSGTNPKQLAGDSAKTAFELSQKMKSQNRRFQDKISTLENGCFKKLFRHILSGVMTEFTAEYLEEISDTELDFVKRQLNEKKVAPQDFTFDKNGKPIKKKAIVQLNLGDDSRYDVDEKRIVGGGDGIVPAKEETLWPTDYTETGALPDIVVKGEVMLGNDKDLRLAQDQAAIDIARVAMQDELAGVGQSNIDIEKLYTRYYRDLGLDDKEWMKESEESLGIDEKLKQIESLNSPSPNDLLAAQQPPNAGITPPPAQGPQQAPAPTPDGLRTGSGASNVLASPLERGAQAA